MILLYNSDPSPWTNLFLKELISEENRRSEEREGLPYPRDSKSRVCENMELFLALICLACFSAVSSAACQAM